jgi:hypothetical protein
MGLRPSECINWLRRDSAQGDYAQRATDRSFLSRLTIVIVPRPMASWEINTCLGEPKAEGVTRFQPITVYQ